MPPTNLAAQLGDIADRRHLPYRADKHEDAPRGPSLQQPLQRTAAHADCHNRTHAAIGKHPNDTQTASRRMRGCRDDIHMARPEKSAGLLHACARKPAKPAAWLAAAPECYRSVSQRLAILQATV